jgi:hypothetical protein
VDTCKDAIFLYESSDLPEELRMVAGVAESFNALPSNVTTWVQICHSLGTAAVAIDDFKAKTCGSPYSLAVININHLTGVDDLKFLLRPDVLGDPRCIFLASLRYMAGEVYALAKEKVQRESEERGRSPSCIGCYGSAGRDELYAKFAELAAAYLQESEERAKAKREGTVLFGHSPAQELLKKSPTTFYGKRGTLARACNSGGTSVL